MWPLLKCAKGVGHINVEADSDGVVRSLYLREGPPDATAPQLAWLAFTMSGEPSEMPGEPRGFEFPGLASRACSSHPVYRPRQPFSKRVLCQRITWRSLPRAVAQSPDSGRSASIGNGRSLCHTALTHGGNNGGRGDPGQRAQWIAARSQHRGLARMGGCPDGNLPGGGATGPAALPPTLCTVDDPWMYGSRHCSAHVPYCGSATGGRLRPA